MSESDESSYYEVALTSRQVQVSFVILLSCVMAAFVSGVWVGRNGQGSAPGGGEQAASLDASSDLDDLEELKLLSEQKADEALRKPDLDGMLRQDRPREAAAGSTLAEEVGSAPVRTAPPPPPRQTAPPPPRQATPPPPAPSAAAAGSASGFVIQVFATKDQPRAEKVLSRLRGGGYKAFLSPVKVGSQMRYRVRIGPFTTRPPAEKVAREVTLTYKLDTWITAAGN